MALELWLALPTPIQPAGSSSQVSETKNQVPHSPQLSFRSYGTSMGDTTAVISHLCKLHVTQEKWKGYVVEKSGISPSPQLVFIGQRLLCQVWQAKNMCVFVFSHVWLFVTPWKGIFRQEYWSGLPFPTPRDLPNPGIEPTSLVSPALAGRFFTTVPPGKPIRLSPQLNLPHLTCRMEVSRRERQVKETKGCHPTQFPDWKTGMSLREAVNWIMVLRYCLGKAGDTNTGLQGSCNNSI